MCEITNWIGVFFNIKEYMKRLEYNASEANNNLYADTMYFA